MTALVRNSGVVEKAVSLGKNYLRSHGMMANLEDPGRLANLVASNLDLKSPMRRESSTGDPAARLKQSTNCWPRARVVDGSTEINTQLVGNR